MGPVPTPCSWAAQHDGEIHCMGEAAGCWRSPAPARQKEAPRALCLGHGELMQHHHGWQRVDAPLPS